MINMRRTKSYMVPKLICVNILALMMFTIEQKAPADDQPLFKTAKVKEPATSNQGGFMQVSVNTVQAEPPAAEAVKKTTVMKKTAVYKNRMHHNRKVMHGSAMLVKARQISNSPVDCCFRGNRT
jgi:hypothetical protein